MEHHPRHDKESHPLASLRGVRWNEDLEVVRRLFQEYRDWLAGHQDPAPASHDRVTAGLALVDKLTSALPGEYTSPHGDILLWFHDDSVVACGALRELEPRVGEIRRIHVRPDFRGKAFGRPFVQALLDRAKSLGYRKLRVDTLSSMTAAIEFYQEAGFHPIPGFWPHPVAGALFFERDIV